MKANYLQRNRSKYSYAKKILILAVTTLLSAVVLNIFSGIIASTLSRIWQADNAITRGLNYGITFLNLQKNLAEDNVRLKERISSLEAQVLSLGGLKVEKDILLQLANQKSNPQVITAAVLVRPPETPYDIVIIDAGSDELISPGSEVSMPEGPILGLVQEVSSRSAKVRLFSTPGEETGAVLERNNIPVTLVGVGGGNFKLNIPRDIKVEKGDRILSAGVSSRLLAVVGDVSYQPTDSFKEVLAGGPINMFVLRFVFIKP